jgi:hypothetical protein
MKKLLCLKFKPGYLFLLFLSFFFTSSLFAEVRLYIDQPSYNLNYGQEITISVKAEGLVEPLRGYELDLSFDPEFLAVTGLSAFQEGTFLSDNGTTQWFVIGSNGNYQVTCAILGVTSGSTGSGTLFDLTLSSLASSTGPLGTDIVLSDVVMRGILNNDITVDVTENSNIVIETQTFMIPLNLGWNLVSSPVLPYDLDMEAVFAQLINDGYLIKVQDEAGNVLVQNLQGDWVNSIGNYGQEEGYYVKVNAACNLYIHGYNVITPLNISLQPGWNIISYPYLTPQDALTILQPLINANQLVKVQDERGIIIIKNSFGVWINNIGNFTSGEGYYINVNANTTLTYPAP